MALKRSWAPQIKYKDISLALFSDSSHSSNPQDKMATNRLAGLYIYI